MTDESLIDPAANDVLAKVAPSVRTERPLRRRAVLHLSSEHLAALLRLPDDVDIVAFTLDPLRDSIGFAP